MRAGESGRGLAGHRPFYFPIDHSVHPECGGPGARAAESEEGRRAVSLDAQWFLGSSRMSLSPTMWHFLPVACFGISGELGMVFTFLKGYDTVGSSGDGVRPAEPETLTAWRFAEEVCRFLVVGGRRWEPGLRRLERRTLNQRLRGHTRAVLWGRLCAVSSHHVSGFGSGRRGWVIRY